MTQQTEKVVLVVEQVQTTPEEVLVVTLEVEPEVLQLTQAVAVEVPIIQERIK